MTPFNFEGASVRCYDEEIWERLRVSDGPDIQQKLDILRLVQGRVFREKGRMKAATEAVFFMPDSYSLKRSSCLSPKGNLRSQAQYLQPPYEPSA